MYNKNGNSFVVSRGGVPENAKKRTRRRNVDLVSVRTVKRLEVGSALLASASLSLAAFAQSDKPNILIIGGDGVGWENVSAYGMGVLG